MKKFASRSDRRPAVCGDPALIEGVSCHVERFVGPIDFVFHETDSEIVHVDVHHVPPAEERPFHTLVTSGMAELPMSVPGIPEAREYGELFLLLPPEWRLSPDNLGEGKWSWPVHSLRELARRVLGEVAVDEELDRLRYGAVRVRLAPLVPEAREPALPVGREEPQRVPALGLPRVSHLAALEDDVVDRALGEAAAHRQAGVPRP